MYYELKLTPTNQVRLDQAIELAEKLLAVAKQEYNTLFLLAGEEELPNLDYYRNLCDFLIKLTTGVNISHVEYKEIYDDYAEQHVIIKELLECFNKITPHTKEVPNYLIEPRRALLTSKFNHKLESATQDLLPTIVIEASDTSVQENVYKRKLF